MHKYFSEYILHTLGLRFLVRLCTDIGLKEVQEYATKLKRLEKMKEIREQRIKSGRDGSGGSRSKREGSAGYGECFLSPQDSGLIHGLLETV